MLCQHPTQKGGICTHIADIYDPKLRLRVCSAHYQMSRRPKCSRIADEKVPSRRHQCMHPVKFVTPEGERICAWHAKRDAKYQLDKMKPVTHIQKDDA